MRTLAESFYCDRLIHLWSHRWLKSTGGGQGVRRSRNTGGSMGGRRRMGRARRGEQCGEGNLNNACDHCTGLHKHRWPFRLFTTLAVNLPMQGCGAQHRPAGLSQGCKSAVENTRYSCVCTCDVSSTIVHSSAIACTCKTAVYLSWQVARKCIFLLSLKGDHMSMQRGT